MTLQLLDTVNVAPVIPARLNQHNVENLVSGGLIRLMAVLLIRFEDVT